MDKQERANILHEFLKIKNPDITLDICLEAVDYIDKCTSTIFIAKEVLEVFPQLKQYIIEK